MIGQLTARRRFLQYLAASPLMAGATDALAQEQRLPDPSVWGTRTLDKLIASPREAINVFDFEPVMHEKVPPAHFGYMRPASTTK
jgi:4-hydroxymandelate oxidase